MTGLNRQDYISQADYDNFRNCHDIDIPLVMAELERAEAILKQLQSMQATFIDNVLTRYFEKIVAMLHTADKSLCCFGRNYRPHLVEGWHNVHRASSGISSKLVTYCDTHAYHVSKLMADGALAANEDRNQVWARMLRASFESPGLFDARGIDFGKINLAKVLQDIDPEFPLSAHDLLDQLVISNESIAQATVDSQPATV